MTAPAIPATAAPAAPATAAPATAPAATIRSGDTGRIASPRHYLMCRPTYFDVSYEINPWMDTTVPVDHDLVQQQWQHLHDVYVGLGHRVAVLEGVPGLPDMVFAANGATVVDGHALGVRFHHPQRRAEAAHFTRWLREHGYPVRDAVAVNEGEGDFLTLGDHILAASGYRSDPASHAELAETFGRPVLSLDLIDPRFYHIDTALAVLSEHHIAYLPQAFSPASRALLATHYPDAIEVSLADACVFGLNAVSDGRHVVVAAQARDFADQLSAAGYLPVPVDLSELRKGGGGIKCATLELRGER